MNITINGKETRVDQETSLTELVTSLKLPHTGIVIERNKEAVFPRDYDKTLIKQGDRIEIVTIAAGG